MRKEGALIYKLSAPELLDEAVIKAHSVEKLSLQGGLTPGRVSCRKTTINRGRADFEERVRILSLTESHSVKEKEKGSLSQEVASEAGRTH